MGTVRVLLELRDLFGILLGVIDDVLGMIRLSRASRRLEGRRACCGMVVVMVVRSGRRRVRGRADSILYDVRRRFS